MNNSIFVVVEEPYCIWEVDLPRRNMEFINGIDVEYFDYLTKLHLEAGDEKRASIALRTTLHHAIETMFLLLGAYIQAPDCAYAWIAKCSNKDLRTLVAKINGAHDSLFTKLKISKVSWEDVGQSVFRFYEPGTEKSERTAKLFASFWRQLAFEYVDQNHVDEYNSLKHGFRVRSGGFALAVGLQHERGVPPPKEEMQLLGQSEYGTSFFRVEPIGNAKGNRNFTSRRLSLNWKVEKVALLTQLASMSINNVVSALKIANGDKPSTCKVLRPVDDADFEKPWRYTPGVTSCTMDFVIDEKDVIPTTRSMLLSKLNALKK